MDYLLKIYKSFARRSAFTFLFLIAFYFSGFSQSDIVVLHYKYYTSYFSASEHIPLLVKFVLTNRMLSCSHKVKRTNKFRPDPEHYKITDLFKDYKNSHYDRGHNMSSANNKCDPVGMNQCFYFSNMTPQPHAFNAGDWEQLEKFERREADRYGKVIVTIGSVGKHAAIGKDKVVVPDYMWKVIYIPSSNTYKCYYFPDSDTLTKPFYQYKVSLLQIEKLAKVTFRLGNAELKY